MATINAFIIVLIGSFYLIYNSNTFPIGLLYNNNYDDNPYLEQNTNDDGFILHDLYDKLIKFSKQNKETKKSNKTKSKIIKI